VLAVVLCSALVGMAMLAAPGHSNCENCGIQSLFDLSALGVGELTPEQKSDLMEAYGAGEISMLDIKTAAQRIDISLRGVAATLTELSRLPGPKILHLRNPDHFTVLAAYRPGLAQLMAAGAVAVVSEEELGSRYTGHALVLQREGEAHGPRLELSNFAFGFGVATPEDAVKFPFTVTNTGDEELRVELKAGCCGAADVLFTKERLAPGESAEGLVVAEIARRGRIMASRGILTNDPDRPMAYLTVYGYVPPDVTVYPVALFVSGEKEDALSAAVVVRGPADMDSPEVSCEKGSFEVALAAGAVDGHGVKTWRIQLSRKPSVQVEEIRDQLRILPGPDRPVLVVPIRAVVWPDLEVRPSRLFLGLVGPYQCLERALVISSRHSRDFAIVDARSDAAGVSLGTLRNRDGKWVVPFWVELGDPGVLRTMITLSTDVPGEETLTVPVYAHVVEPRKNAGGES